MPLIWPPVVLKMTSKDLLKNIREKYPNHDADIRQLEENLTWKDAETLFQLHYISDVGRVSAL